MRKNKIKKGRYFFLGWRGSDLKIDTNKSRSIKTSAAITFGTSKKDAPKGKKKSGKPKSKIAVKNPITI